MKETFGRDACDEVPEAKPESTERLSEDILLSEGERRGERYSDEVWVWRPEAMLIWSEGVLSKDLVVASMRLVWCMLLMVLLVTVE